MQELPSGSIDLIIADPTFGVGYSGKESLYNRNSEFIVDGYQEIEIIDYKKFTSEWIVKMKNEMIKPQKMIL